MAKTKQTAEPTPKPKRPVKMIYTYKDEKGKGKVGRVVRDPITGKAEPVKKMTKETKKAVRKQALKFEKKMKEKEEGSEFK